jgi:hypothetical protein
MRKSPIMYHDVKKLQGPGNELMRSTTGGVGASGRELKGGVSGFHPSTTLDGGRSDASSWPRNAPLRSFAKSREEGSIRKMELRLNEIL